MPDDQKLEIVRNYVSLNLKDVVLYGIENGDDEEKRILNIVKNEFLSNPIYVNRLVTIIVYRLCESNALRYKTCSIYELSSILCDTVTPDLLYKYVAMYHPFAYSHLMNIRQREIEQTGIIR